MESGEKKKICVLGNSQTLVWKGQLRTTRICLDKQVKVIFVLGRKEKLCSNEEAFGCKPKNSQILHYVTVDFTQEVYHKPLNHHNIALCFPPPRAWTWEELKLRTLVCLGLRVRQWVPWGAVLLLLLHDPSYLVVMGSGQWHPEQTRLLQGKGVLWEPHCPASAWILHSPSLLFGYQKDIPQQAMA